MTTKKWFWWLCLILATVVCLAGWIYIAMIPGTTIVSILALYCVTIGIIMGWVQIL